MPLPTVKKGKSEKEFIGRCISTLAHEKGGDRWPDNEQRIAVCYSQWEKANEDDILDKIESYLIELEEEGITTGDISTDAVGPSGVCEKRMY